MTEEKRSFTLVQRCNHCGNTAPMEIVRQYSQVQNVEVDPTGLSYEQGNVYELLVCPACEGVALRRYFWHEAMEPDEVEIETLYPSVQGQPEGLPDKIARAFEAAVRVRTVDANAYGVLAGRVLELVCIDRNATGRFLGNQLADLAAKGEIPAKLVDVANGLKDLRNVGAHAALGGLTPAEVPILDQLTRAILEYVYSAPHLAQKAEARLRQLRSGGTKILGLNEQGGDN